MPSTIKHSILSKTSRPSFFIQRSIARIRSKSSLNRGEQRNQRQFKRKTISTRAYPSTGNLRPNLKINQSKGKQQITKQALNRKPTSKRQPDWATKSQITWRLRRRHPRTSQGLSWAGNRNKSVRLSPTTLTFQIWKRKKTIRSLIESVELNPLKTLRHCHRGVISRI